MWNEPFEHLRRRLTFVYMMILVLLFFFNCSDCVQLYLV